MNPNDILKYGHRTVLGAIHDIKDDQWTVGGVCGVWSCKDVIGHLGVYELVLVDVLGTFLSHTPSPVFMEMGEMGPLEFNDTQAARRKNKTADEILREYTNAHARVMELVPQIPAETWRKTGTLPWYGEEYALDDYVVYSNYGHKREHTAEINAFRSRSQ